MNGQRGNETGSNLHIETNSNTLHFFSELKKQLRRHQIYVVQFIPRSGFFPVWHRFHFWINLQKSLQLMSITTIINSVVILIIQNRFTPKSCTALLCSSKFDLLLGVSFNTLIAAKYPSAPHLHPQILLTNTDFMYFLINFF